MCIIVIIVKLCYNLYYIAIIGGFQMKFLGIILSILGCLSSIYGINLNNSFEAQLTSLFSNGSKNPGTTWIVIGVIIAIIGIVLILKKTKNSTDIQ